MKERFEGEEGQRRLVGELRNQHCFRCNPEMADDVAAVLSLRELARGDALIRQGGEDTDMYFILAGEVDIVVNDQVLISRRAGEHVGEMALIDPKARRSATVIAKDTVVVGVVTEPDFTRVAVKHPGLWRYLALELGERLRQRNAQVRQRNARPQLFIGCSVEALKVAQEIQLGLSHDPISARVWTDGVFQASRGAIADLMAQVKQADFAVMVFTPDDKTVSRDKSGDVPRDNVVFELGLFMGDVGPERTLVVRPRGVTLKVPSDLLGLTPLEYNPAEPDLTAAIAPVCTGIRKRVSALGPK